MQVDTAKEGLFTCEERHTLVVNAVVKIVMGRRNIFLCRDHCVEFKILLETVLTEVKKV